MRESAERLAKIVCDLKLTNPYGGDVTKATVNKKVLHTVSFSVPRTVDGSLSVYGEKFVVVRFITQIRFLPHNGRYVFDEQTAAKFIKAAFVDHDEEEVCRLISLAR